MSLPDFNPKDMNILMVDDVITNLEILKVILNRHGYNVFAATSGESALKEADKVKPDLILLDIMMPGIDGYETCEELKKNPATAEIPVIFLTAKSQPDDLIKGFTVGGVDYVTKPYMEKEVSVRIKTHLQLRTLMKERSEVISELNRLNEKCIELSKTDELTGLHNRRSVLALLENEKIRFDQNKINFSIIIGNIDLFSKINENLGKEAGDHALIQVGNLINSNLGPLDVAGRWAEDSFIIILPGKDIKTAVFLSDNLRNLINSEVFKFNGKSFKFSMSFGVALHDQAGFVEDLVYKAEGNLDQAKKEGRNRVVSS